MATDPWKKWAKGIGNLFLSGTGYNAQTGQQYSTAQPSFPNPGTYDPAYDIQAENARLGNFRYQQDFSRDWGELGAGASGGRQGIDLQTALARGNQQQAWGQQNFNRSQDDLRRSRTRGNEDYLNNLDQLKRNYRQLAGTQAQQMRAKGVAQGGAVQQAARKRAENHELDQQPVVRNFQRFAQDNNLALNRLGEDNHRAQTQAQWGIGDLMQGYQRNREDAVFDYGRTGTDLENYLGGLGRLAYYTSNQIQPAGASILELMKRKGTSR